MAHKYSGKVSFPGKSPAEVWAFYATEGYITEVVTAAGGFDVKPSVTTNADGSATIVRERTQPTTGLPDFAKKIAGENIHVVETVQWSAPAGDGGRTGKLDIKFSGPLHTTGAMVLRAAGGGSEIAIDFETKASVPLIGSKLEKTAEAETHTTMATETSVAAKY